MFFGGVNGFNAFYPQSIKDNPYVPPIVLTSLTQGGEEVGAGVAAECIGEVIFRWPNNFFEFEFAALSYVQPEKNRYAYMLEGFDEEWNDVGKRRFGRYTNLPPGTYELRVKGSNNDGIWNEDGASVTITIVPPFWETWWFRGLAFLMIVGGIIGGYRMRIRSIQAQSRELEKLVGERTREIERRQRVAEGLREILVILNSDRSLEESLDYIASQAALLTDAQDALVFRRDDACPTGMTVVAGKDLPVPMARWIVRTVSPGHPLIVSDLANCLDAPSASVRHCAVLGVPLSVGEGMYGGLVLLYGKGRVFSEEDLELGFTFADQAVLAIANARLRDRAERTAVEMERNRLARDLHDAVTQTLFSASLIAEALPAVWESDPNEGRDLLAEVRRLSRGALAEMRTLLLELRPTALVETSLEDLLRQLAEVVAGRKEVSIEVMVEGECAMPPDVHVALYRIAQEALNNVAKHAHASRVTVSLRRSPLEGDGQVGQRVKLCVSDDGCGFDPTSVPPDHLGLGIVRERAQAIGATLTIESHSGGGTCITVVWMDMSEG